MESQLGEDLSNVLVHTDEEGSRSAAALDARAYTVGRQIYFARGMYAPKGAEGRRLLAHELTHVVQQEPEIGSPAVSNELSGRDGPAEHEAEAVAHTVDRGERAPKISSKGKGIQKDDAGAQKGPQPDPYGAKLLKDFAGKFSDAAKLINKNAAAMKLVKEAEAGGVQFGGYAEDGPAKAAGRAYTVGNTVYVPKTRTDPPVAMRDFLFELNNALRAPKFAELAKEAAKGSHGQYTAKQYAQRIVELEVEGMSPTG